MPHYKVEKNDVEAVVAAGLNLLKVVFVLRQHGNSLLSRRLTLESQWFQASSSFLLIATND